MPTPKDIAKLYTNYHTHHLGNNLPAWLFQISKQIEASILASAFEYDNGTAVSTFKVLGWWLSRIRFLRERAGRMVMWLKAPCRGRLLDVGCGNGAFLCKMRELGWTVVGIDPDSKATHIAKEKFGLEVYQSCLEEAGFEDCTFDAITMNNVIEHLADPLRTLSECRRILKPKGRVVLLTPNSASLGHAHFHQDWRGLEPPRHLFLFNLQGLRYALAHAHLHEEHSETVVQGAASVLARSKRLRDIRLSKNRAESKKNTSTEIESKTLLKCILYQLWESLALLANPGIGEELLVIATRE